MKSVGGHLWQNEDQHMGHSILLSTARNPPHSDRRLSTIFRGHHQNGALQPRRSRPAMPSRSQALSAHVPRHGSSWTSHHRPILHRECVGLPRWKTFLLRCRAIPPSRPVILLCPALQHIHMSIRCPKEQHLARRENWTSSRLERPTTGLPRKITSRRNRI
jgi:hypothetical protein